ncbi:MAG: hypothetical protein IT442_09445 [Phycisphaeraceae bacterium]|nr:hypothetical protein [Phycisphaeraceae bacterium]
MRWSPADIADAVAAGLVLRAADDDDEQAVYGFDALDELGLHTILRHALEEAGYGVHPEQRYPEQRLRPRRSEGKRCDMVLTPDGLPLRDPLVAGTLFDQQPAVDADLAYWLEVKTVAQHQTDGPFARYSAELLQPVTQDVKKIWSDPVIRHGGLLLVLFTETQRIAEHDILAWHERCLEKGYPVAAPALRGLPITDRIGNAWCAAALFPIRNA